MMIVDEIDDGMDGGMPDGPLLLRNPSCSSFPKLTSTFKSLHLSFKEKQKNFHFKSQSQASCE